MSLSLSLSFYTLFMGKSCKRPGCQRDFCLSPPLDVEPEKGWSRPELDWLEDLDVALRSQKSGELRQQGRTLEATNLWLEHGASVERDENAQKRGTSQWQYFCEQLSNSTTQTQRRSTSGKVPIQTSRHDQQGKRYTQEETQRLRNPSRHTRCTASQKERRSNGSWGRRTRRLPPRRNGILKKRRAHGGAGYIHTAPRPGQTTKGDEKLRHHHRRPRHLRVRWSDKINVG